MSMHKIINIFAVLAALFGMALVSACTDDYLPNPTPGEGEADVSCNVRFEPLASALESRAPGNAIRNINTLTVLVYDIRGKFIRSYTQDELTDYAVNQEGNKDFPEIDGSGEHYNPTQAETATARATFTIPKLPYGRYKIYCVANVALTPAEMKDIELVRNKTITWQAGNISANNAMFGYFVNADKDVTTGGANGFDAPPVIVGRDKQNIHSWIKRCSSKLTVAFDGSKLHNNVYVYIKSVTLHDIPKTCKLGADNRPTEQSQLINPYNVTAADAEQNTVMYYNNKYQYGPESGTHANPGTDYNNWLMVTNASGPKYDGLVGSDHSENANALYFFENNQGDYEDAPDKREYDKRQQWSEVGEIINQPTQKDFKDNVRWGTYVEVEAYYRSTNTANIGYGKIIYRFMLGKNITYNYNASRNHHFKLTLGFRGWANQPDWHIEYTEPEPALLTPNFYVSYLYNTRHTYNFKVNGNVKRVTMKIIENNWAPYDYKTGELAPEKTGNFEANPNTWFTWNKLAYTTGPAGQLPFDGKSRPWCGFLALQMPNLDKNIIDLAYSKKEEAQNALKNYYLGKGSGNNLVNQSERVFEKADLEPGQHKASLNYNDWTVTKVDDDAIMLHVPMWTRNKTMINLALFGGYNPYEAYQRKAVVRITAEFENGVTKTSDVEVVQARRIANPVGVWRKYDRQNSFTVGMMTREGASASKYTLYQSEGDWEAYIEKGDHSFTLSTVIGGTSLKGDTIKGNTNTPVKFNVNFHGCDIMESKCAVLRINYNNSQCVHRIMLRQGVYAPLAVVGDTKWSSFNVYSGTTRENSDNQEHDIVLTKNPLTLGTLFKRVNIEQGILVSNNAREGLGLFQHPGDILMDLSNGKQAKFIDVACTTDREWAGTWGNFHATVNLDNGSVENRDYRMPRYKDFQDLNQAEYIYGVLYGSGASQTQEEFNMAFGYEDGNNTGADNVRGIRGIVLYNNSNANQIFFPIGARGAGRRCTFRVANEWPYLPSDNAEFIKLAGWLKYSQATSLLTGDDNMYRPIPYDTWHDVGAQYWIDHTENSAASWDMNYFAFDFSNYNDYGWRDALPIKLILVESNKNRKINKKKRR